MHDLIIAIVAVVVVGGGGGTGLVAVRRRNRRGPAPTAPPTRRGSRPERVGDEPPGDTLVEERPRDDVAIVEIEAPPDEVAIVPVDDTVVEEPGVVGEPVVGEPVVEEPVVGEPVVQEPVVVERPRLRDRLGKARSLLGGYLTSVRSRDKIDETTWEELEEALILADVGAEIALELVEDLRAKAKAAKVDTPDELIGLLRDDLVARLDGDRTLHLEPGATNVWLIVGVNGVGKTTTIGKLGMRERDAGRSVVMAAGDTFRAAAADQLAQWAQRVDVDIVRGNEGGDPGAVIFDAVQHAAARNADLVLADTAGRLHNKVNLMEELKKGRRVAERPPGRISEVLLVLDATTGQNGLTQAKQFAGAVGVTGVVLTKLDGTAKGGIALAIQTELGIPIKLVGVGEKAEDLIVFDPVEFVDALVAPDPA